ncbi:MAG: serine protease, partial [Acidimicrobiales bacterium]|nr:serine protease [Acidimicrobiales bacterium]
MGEGYDDEDQVPGAPVPAPDRLWRHPAELGAEQAAANLAARQAGGRRWPSMLASFLAGAALVGLAWLFTDPSPTTIQNIETVVLEAPIRPVVDGPLGLNEWAIEVTEPNRQSAVTLHLGGDAAVPIAQAILYRSDGHLLTSAHAVNGATDINAIVGTVSLPAQVVAADFVSGIAVLKVPTPDVEPGIFSEGSVSARDQVVAMGAMASDDGPLVRVVEVLSKDQVAVTAAGHHLSGLFQLSEPLDNAWAGAPIVDARGGIVAMGVSTRNGVTYAVPTSLAFDIAQDLTDKGSTAHVAWLGVVPERLTDSLKAERDLPGGVLVSKVWSESAAAKGGLVAGDIILGIGSVNVLEPNDLLSALR